MLDEDDAARNAGCWFGTIYYSSLRWDSDLPHVQSWVVTTDYVQWIVQVRAIDTQKNEHEETQVQVPDVYEFLRKRLEHSVTSFDNSACEETAYPLSQSTPDTTPSSATRQTTAG
ncbi:hypothetical protein N7456_000076 [Penicillium angulare]|uniref:Uncharacterized protein n=1 Tax=Penicillium angulare TaxID=116970 RepID=A0A9W9KRK0_9EURO|nr:hypothetical protein N7456_000076 [Penicillium angulare]